MTRQTFFAGFALLLLSACNQPETKSSGDTASDTPKAKPSSAPSTALADYKRFVSSLDPTDVESATAAARKYSELFEGEDPATRDKGFLVFNALYLKLDTTLNDLHTKDTTNYEALVMTEVDGTPLPVSKKAREYNTQLKRNGFEVSSTEGNTYVKQERDFIAKWFEPYVSPTMKRYLVQMNKENKEGFLEDAALVIEPKPYTDRVVWWEEFIRNNPSFPLLNKAVDNHRWLLTFYLEGVANTPLLHYDTNGLDDYFKTAYAYLQIRYPDSEAARLVNPYAKALLQNDPKSADALLNKYRREGVIIDFSDN